MLYRSVVSYKFLPWLLLLSNEIGTITLITVLNPRPPTKKKKSRNQDNKFASFTAWKGGIILKRREKIQRMLYIKYRSCVILRHTSIYDDILTISTIQCREDSPMFQCLLVEFVDLKTRNSIWNIIQGRIVIIHIN